jgi:hypothetical protein
MLPLGSWRAKPFTAHLGRALLDGMLTRLLVQHREVLNLDSPLPFDTEGEATDTVDTAAPPQSYDRHFDRTTFRGCATRSWSVGGDPAGVVKHQSPLLERCSPVIPTSGCSGVGSTSSHSVGHESPTDQAQTGRAQTRVSETMDECDVLQSSTFRANPVAGAPNVGSTTQPHEQVTATLRRAPYTLLRLAALSPRRACHGLILQRSQNRNGSLDRC